MLPIKPIKGELIKRARMMIDYYGEPVRDTPDDLLIDRRRVEKGGWIFNIREQFLWVHCGERLVLSVGPNDYGKTDDRYATALLNFMRRELVLDELARIDDA